jgi:hypothetical protein
MPPSAVVWLQAAQPQVLTKHPGTRVTHAWKVASRASPAERGGGNTLATVTHQCHRPYAREEGLPGVMGEVDAGLKKATSAVSLEHDKLSYASEQMGQRCSFRSCLKCVKPYLGGLE